MNTLEKVVRERMSGTSEALVTAIANYVSPSTEEKYVGMPDNKQLEITVLKDSTKFQFGSGQAFPGFDVLQDDENIGFLPAPRVSANMDPGTTWNLIIVLQSCFTALGFWRLEWTEGGKGYVAVGVLPTANAIIRGSVRYIAKTAGASTPTRPIWLGVITDGNTSNDDPLSVLPLQPLVSSLAGRVRMPACSVTTHLDAPSLVDQGMVASSLLGQSFAPNGNDVFWFDQGSAIGVSSGKQPVMTWAGPRLGNETNITSIVQTMANDPTRFVEKPLKVDGSYDIARSATLDWVPGIATSIDNPLYVGTFATGSGATALGVPYRVLGIVDQNVAPMLIAYTNMSQQASLNLRNHCLVEIEPEIASPFMPFRGLVPHSTKITEYFKAFAQACEAAAHTFPASANDEGLLATAVQKVMKEAGPKPSTQAVTKPASKMQALKAGIDGATQVATTYFNPINVGHRNTRKQNVRVVKAQEKTKRKAIKKQPKS